MNHSKQVTIRILDEVTCAVVGLSSEDLIYFYNKYSYYAPNYNFNPKYKRGIWDGKLHFFHKQGKTFVFLLDDILPRIKNLGYKLNLHDLRESVFVDVPQIDYMYFSHIIKDGNPLILRWYQVESVNALTKNGNGIVIASTGSGKTYINAALVDLYGKKGLKTITIVPSETLITQTIKDFDLVGLDYGEYSGRKKNTEPTHVVSTWQALQHNPYIMTLFQVVVVDEAHGLRGPILNSLLNDAGKHIPYRFGLTATLPTHETEQVVVKTAIGKVLYQVKTNTLIKEDVLSNLHITVYELTEDFHFQYNTFKKNNLTNIKYYEFKNGYFPDYPSEKAYLQNNVNRQQWIANLLQEKREIGNTFCLVNSITFGKKLMNLIPNSYFVYGKDEVKARQEIYDLFTTQDNVLVIATVSIAGIGLNIPRIFNLGYIDIGKSFIRVIQAIGRGLRKADDKNFVNILDIGSDLKYSKKHSNQRLQYYNQFQYPYSKNKVDYVSK
jgi:superfamily II DNA or RNA helicase